MSFKWATEWTRSDAIAGLALVFAAAAAGIAYQAENRAEKAEQREAEAVAIAIGGKVRQSPTALNSLLNLCRDSWTTR
jgi:hypothetical protein